MVTVQDRPATTPYTTAHTAALAAVQSGLSVIPLRGKRPALSSWKAYQGRPPTPDELHRWFVADSHTAYGIVCGRLSQLVVLDLDAPDLAEAFAARFPHLADTFTARSGQRHTPHLYWRADFAVRSRKFQHADLQGEGKYVVGPGSTINGQQWQIARDAPIRAISLTELNEVLAFLGSTPKPPQLAPVPAHNRTLRSAHDYQAIYTGQVAASGSRNDSLFFTACLARDDSHPQAWTVNTLADLHARQPASGQHRLERYEQRRQEACRTIASAYSRPPRPGKEDELVSRLPNALREALLAQPDGTAILRTLESLSLKGVRPGDTFSRRQALELLSGVVGDFSIRKALAAATPDGSPLFPRSQTLTPATADTDASPDGRQSNASLSAGKNQQPPLYTSPDLTKLCQAFSVQPRGGDPIRLADLTGVKPYRLALQREFIRRRPGRYHQHLLAARLGVSDRTIRTYHREIPIYSLPQYIERPICWACLSLIPSTDDADRFNLDLGGHFLEDETGKRYPCKQEIARVLLSQGHRVTYKRQTTSFYYYGDTPPAQAFAAVRTATGPPLARQVQAFQQEKSPLHFRQLPLLALAHSAESTRSILLAKRDTPAIPAARPARPTPPTQNRLAPPRRRRHYQKPLPNRADEKLAQQLHADVDRLSLGNARQLVAVYGRDRVKRLFNKLQRQRTRGRGVANPAGWLITALRVEWKWLHGTAPGYESQLPRKPRAQRRPPPPVEHDPLWQSPSYQAWRTVSFETWPDSIEAELPY